MDVLDLLRCLVVCCYCIFCNLQISFAAGTYRFHNVMDQSINYGVFQSEVHSSGVDTFGECGVLCGAQRGCVGFRLIENEGVLICERPVLLEPEVGILIAARSTSEEIISYMSDTVILQEGSDEVMNIQYWNDELYVIYTGSLTHTDADNRCQEIAPGIGKLLYIETVEEQDFIWSTVKTLADLSGGDDTWYFDVDYTHRPDGPIHSTVGSTTSGGCAALCSPSSSCKAAVFDASTSSCTLYSVRPKAMIPDMSGLIITLINRVQGSSTNSVNFKGFHMGIRKNSGNWQFESEYVTYENFYGEQDNENCAYFNLNLGGGWATDDCETINRGFICEIQI